MKDYVPLLQSIVWPTFLIILIYWGRSYLYQILDAIRVRIETGDTLEAGSSGLKLTANGQVVRDTPNRPLSGMEDGSDAMSISEADESDEIPTGTDANPGFYVVHKARRDRSLDRGEFEYYRLRIFLEWDPGVDEIQVVKVVYHFPEGFKKRERQGADVETQFEHRTVAWGQCNVLADVYLKGRDNPIQLERYLNF